MNLVRFAALASLFDCSGRVEMYGSNDRASSRGAGLDGTGRDGTGLDWTGLDWTGLDWTGPDRPRFFFTSRSFDYKSFLLDLDPQIGPSGTGVQWRWNVQHTCIAAAVDEHKGNGDGDDGDHQLIDGRTLSAAAVCV